MSTNNFAFENRCVVVEDDDYVFGNIPEHGEYVKSSNRNYASYYLDEHRNRFYMLDIVITSAYYSGGCIDYIEDNSYLDTLSFYSGNAIDIVQEIMSDFKAFNVDRKKVEPLAQGIVNDNLNDYTAYDQLRVYLFSLEKPEADKILDQIKAEYGYTEVCKIGNFCNGEVLYEELKPQSI